MAFLGLDDGRADGRTYLKASAVLILLLPAIPMAAIGVAWLLRALKHIDPAAF